MPILAAYVAIGAISIWTPTFVQAQRAPAQSETTPPARSSTVIHSVRVVEIKELEPTARSKTDDNIADGVLAVRQDSLKSEYWSSSV